MNMLHHRPLFLWCVAFSAAAAGGYVLFDVWKSSFASPWAVFLCLVALFFLMGAMGGLILGKKKQRRRTVTVCIAVLSAMLGLWQSFMTFAGERATYVQSLHEETVTLEAVVTERRGEGGYLSSFALEVRSIDDGAFGGAALLTCHYLADLSPGDVIRLTAQVLPLEEVVGDGYSAGILQGDGYLFGLLSESEEDIEFREERDSSWRLRVSALRRTLAARLTLLTERGAGLPSALLLGDRSALYNEVRRDFARAGVSHLLAISGLHMTLLFGVLDGLLRLLRFPKKGRASLLLLAALGYLVLLGFPPSATRAVIMLGFVYLSVLLTARADALTALGLSGVLILVCTPYAVADAGFWMSYLATLGLVAIMPWVNTRVTSFRAREGWYRRLCAPLIKVGVGVAVGVIAMSCTLAIVAAVIRETGILSPVSTLLLTPLCGAVILLSLLTLPFFGTVLGDRLGQLIEAICSWMTELAARMAEPRWVVISLTHPAILPMAIIMTAALLVLLCIRLPARRRWVPVLPLLIGWTLIGATVAIADLTDGDKPEVSFLQPSSQADMLVLVEGRDAVICDLSNGSLSSLTAASVEASRRGATEIAVLMLTHYHERTVATLGELLSRETVRELWLPTPSTNEEYDTMLSYCEKAEAAGVTVTVYERGVALRVFGTGELTLQSAALDRSTQPVLLVTLDTEPTSEQGGELVYCGSAVFESELSRAASAAVASSDAVIFGNHGPLVKRSFGEGLSYREDVRIVLSEYGDVAACFRADSVPETGELWQGQWRFEWDEKTQ